jgi:rare lipoprotein A
MNARGRSTSPRMMTLLVMLVTVSMADHATARTGEVGVATFYSDKFEGKRTAHKKLPFGTKVKVRNVANGKSVVVTINDRMAASTTAVIDVTRHAAEELGFVRAGKAKVRLEVQK